MAVQTPNNTDIILDNDVGFDVDIGKKVFAPNVAGIDYDKLFEVNPEYKEIYEKQQRKNKNLIPILVIVILIMLVVK